MSKYELEDESWDEGCLECGTLHYREGQIPGVCAECAGMAYEGAALEMVSTRLLSGSDSSWGDGWSES